MMTGSLFNWAYFFLLSWESATERRALRTGNNKGFLQTCHLNIIILRCIQGRIIQMWWIGCHVRYGLCIFLWQAGWWMLCLFWLKSQHQALHRKPKDSPIISPQFKAGAEETLLPMLRAHRQEEEEEEEVGGGGVLVDRTAGNEPSCLAGSSEIPLHTNHTSFPSSSSSLSCVLAFLSLSSSSLSLQVTVCARGSHGVSWQHGLTSELT